MNATVDNAINALREFEPETYKACQPRRIVPPAGFINPKYFALTLRSGLMSASEPSMRMLAHMYGAVHAFKHIELGVPTYFVRSEFAQAVAQTNPPEDFKMSEIKWPMDAMLFALPVDFSRRHFGYTVPFVSVVRVPAGVYPQCVKLPRMNYTLEEFQQTDNKCDRIVVLAPLFDGTMPCYSGGYNMDHNIGQLPAMPYEDATFVEEIIYGDRLLSAGGQVPAGDDEVVFRNKVINYAIKLMLAVTARPGLVKQGALERKASVKHNKVRDELWSPNTVGWDYRAARPSAAPASTGGHNSPRMHWRMGHWRNQAHGEARALRKLLWIEPVLVGQSEA